MKPEGLQEDQRNTPETNLSQTGNESPRTKFLKARSLPLVDYWINNALGGGIYVRDVDSCSQKEEVYELLVGVFVLENSQNSVVKPFLNTHFDQYYDTLMADHVVQPFFSFLEDLLRAKANDLTKPAYDAVNEWITSHPKYMVEVERPLPLIPSLPTDLTGFKISQMRAALICAYNVTIVKKENSDEVAQSFGFTSPTSGMQLMRKYETVNSELKRVDVEGDQIRYRILDIDAVLPFLSPKGREDAERDKKTIRLKSTNRL